MVHNQSGESPLQIYVLRFVADCNCVVERQGGEQQKANSQSVIPVNSIRLHDSASLPGKGEAQKQSITLMGNVIKR